MIMMMFDLFVVKVKHKSSNIWKVFKTKSFIYQ